MFVTATELRDGGNCSADCIFMGTVKVGTPGAPGCRCSMDAGL